jgi:DNA-binding response OmpR family regulator
MAKILIVDDDPRLRGTLVQVLTRAGHELVEAQDGQDGLNQFRAHRPILVVIDILMPVKEGLETIRELRADAPGVAIIAMSGGDPLFLDIAKMLGADAVLLKPFRSSDLVEAINKLLAT